MTESEPIRLGISGNPDEDVMKRMLGSMSVPVHAFGVDNLNLTDFGAFDVMMLLTPTMEEARADEFVRYLESGLTALVMIDGDTALSGRSRYFAHALGYELEVSRSVDKIRLEYTADYPVPAKRGHSEDLRYQGGHKWMAFKQLPGNYPPIRKTILNRSGLLGRSGLGVLIGIGEGLAILTDGVSRREDRADMLSFLATNSRRRGSGRAVGWAEKARVALPAAAAGLFEVYDEIPFGLLIERAGLDGEAIDGAAFMKVLETLIRERRISARLRRDSLVKQ